MRFGGEGCNWKTVIKNEVLNAFAPRSAWIWKDEQTSKISSPKDDTRALLINEESPGYNRLIEKLKMDKKLILTPQYDPSKYTTTKTEENKETTNNLQRKQGKSLNES
jgi:hypothetical protein